MGGPEEIAVDRLDPLTRPAPAGAIAGCAPGKGVLAGYCTRFFPSPGGHQGRPYDAISGRSIMADASLRKTGYRILLVEDEDFLRRIFKLRLEAEGYDVTDVGAGEAAWEALKTSLPHLIILDLYLPQMTGFEFLERLRAHPALCSVAVLILSGLGQEADIRRGLELGAKEYVVKTKLKPSEFLEKVSKLLEETAPSV